MTDTISPNTPQGAATEQSAVPSLDSIAAKMATMRENTLRNQIRAPEQTATGNDDSAEDSSPVAPSDKAEAEVANSSDSDIDSEDHESEVQSEEPVNDADSDSTADELIDFLEFTETNPNAKFKFMRNGKEVIIDAKKAASILGQGSAIHEEARQLKIERAEFDEYLKEARAKQDGLNLAMEFTVQPQLKTAYDEIIKTQSYQSTFQQQLQQVRDPAQVARIQASMAQNEQYIRQQQNKIARLQPAVEQFRQIRSEQMGQLLDQSRKNFQDKELKNEYVFNEVREKIAKLWPGHKEEAIPGIPNLDLVAADEALLSLLRDGLRYRDKPTTRSAGASMAALTSRKGSSNTQRSGDDGIAKLREQAKGGDKKAADNLLMQRLQSIRGGRR
jgi:hypothetical protein